MSALEKIAQETGTELGAAEPGYQTQGKAVGIRVGDYLVIVARPDEKPRTVGKDQKGLQSLYWQLPDYDGQGARLTLSDYRQKGATREKAERSSSTDF